jgi:polar amino acid transport system substrate-binding protein
MKFQRFIGVLLALVFWGGAHAGGDTVDSDAVAKILAPVGELRVGVYLGSPTSMVVDAKSGKVSGVAVELGEALAAAIHRPVRLVRFDRVAQVIEALKTEQIDMTFTNATASRAKDVDFTPALIRLELGLLVSETASVKRFMDVNDASFRLGVAKGSSSQSALGAKLSQTQIVPVESLDQAQRMLAAGELDGFATNKGILFELNERLRGFKVLDDRWGLESLAIAVPKGRDRAMPYLIQFANQQLQSGSLDEHAKRAGLRGLAKE